MNMDLFNGARHTWLDYLMNGFKICVSIALLLIALPSGAYAANSINVTYTDLGDGSGRYDYSITYDKPANLYMQIHLDDGSMLEYKLTVNFPGYDGNRGIHNPVSATKFIEKVDFVLKDRETDAVVYTKSNLPFPPPEGSTGGSGGTTDPNPGDGGTGGGTDPTDPEPTDPGNGGSTDPGDGGGNTGDCPACELFSCPGWEELADMFAHEIGKEIPPPPDWEEVAGLFGDELVPRMSEEIIDEFIDRGVPVIGAEMTDVLENVLQHPEPPTGIVVDLPPELNGTEGLSKPQPTDSAPPAQNMTFDNVPDILVTPDRTGGIDLSKADPIDTLPHQAPDYKPQPGKETGGFKPQTKPKDHPIPSTLMPGMSTSPPPTPGQTMPGTGVGTPKPDVTVTPPPKPEMPMPSG